MTRWLTEQWRRLAPISDGKGAAAAREALGVSAGMMLLLGASKMLLDDALGVPGAAFTLATAYTLFLPLDRIDGRREDPAAYGIHAHGVVGVPLRLLEAWAFRACFGLGWPAGGRAVSRLLRPYTRHARLNAGGAFKDLGLCLLACVVTFPPFVWGAVEAQNLLAGSEHKVAHFELHWPPAMANLLFTHVVLVAVPEELFYRGYVLTLLLRAWPPRWTLGGASLGRAVWVGSALFALGHFVGEWNPLRLGPFFPALLFCVLRLASGSILGAAIYHGLCNVMGELVNASVVWR